MNCRLLPLHCAVCFSFLHEQTGPPTHPEILSFPCVHWHGASHLGSLGYLTLAAWSACGMQCLFVLCLLLLLHLSALRTTAGLNAHPPPRLKYFAQRVLWHKLTVHERVYKRSSTDKCPICSQNESIKHDMVECSMFKAVAAVIQHYFGTVATGDGEFPPRDMMVRPSRVVDKHGPRLGNVVGKKCPLAMPM